MNNEDRKFLDDIDLLLGHVMKLHEKEVCMVVRRIIKSKHHQRLYIMAFKRHWGYDKDMRECFKMREELRSSWTDNKRFISFLCSLGLAKFRKNPTKKKDNPQRFGLRNPEAHIKIFKKLKSEMNGEI